MVSHRSESSLLILEWLDASNERPTEGILVELFVEAENIGKLSVESCLCSRAYRGLVTGGSSEKGFLV